MYLEIGMMLAFIRYSYKKGMSFIKTRPREFPDFLRVGKSGREMAISRDFPGSREVKKNRFLGNENAEYREKIVYLLLFEPFR